MKKKIWIWYLIISHLLVISFLTIKIFQYRAQMKEEKFISTYDLTIPEGLDIDFSKYKYVPKDGYVPDAKTAAKIAEVVWVKTYGKRIYDERPFKSKLYKGRIWIVKGTLNPPKDDPKALMFGGVAYAFIRKNDGRILEIRHTR